mmetsp:Transcript_68823/g.150398  ORF Transcript_68823/g.150398 Transcript_68823/m.150398 type:complete len:714 (-) Transcript_68823:41-2182(-)|eukprot:CAMPEP_0206535850 /NCGR_PEP_ID=MMETSP0325_2-20121206/6392_1 /ASSEMBLY_ACC=CAM_ASM_000347 /TAXON_ID=2866 /ORGANISM="Crypthecodinium cohnii, Strain Seligo" /LENGTH=713 /DNA_ID=CAMNT_0054032935 /DNA_START=522 /DNA_END=2663 /DNA_ORIENTATION=+
MGRTHFANLTCPHCTRTSSVRCQELEDANSVIFALKRLITDSKLPFFETDAAGVVTFCSDKFAEALGSREPEVVGQSLEDVVAERYRARVTHVLTKLQRQTQDKNNTEISTVRVGGKSTPDASEASMKAIGFYSFDGHLVGSAGFLQLDTNHPKMEAERATLPRPVGGISAFRCALKPMGVGYPSFEMSMLPPSPETSKLNGNNDEDEAFKKLVEKSARSSATSALLSRAASTSARPAPFQSESLQFETGALGTRYYSVRGVAMNGAEMPFGGSMGLAEGYAIDITSLKHEQQETSRWHERWRSLALLSFHFVFLVDITEYRVLRSWGDIEALGTCIEGRLLWDCIPKDDRSSTMNAISTAMSDSVGSQSHELVFRHRNEDRPRIRAQCRMLSDPGDPSLLFLGAQVVSGGSAASDEAAGGGRTSSSSSFGAALKFGSHYLGPLLEEPSAKPTTTTTKGSRDENGAKGDGGGGGGESGAKKLGGGGSESKTSSSTSAPKGAGSGLRLTAAALSLAAGLPAPPPGLGRAEALMREAEEKAIKQQPPPSPGDPIKVLSRPPMGGLPTGEGLPPQRASKKNTTGRRKAGSNTSQSPRSARVPRVFPTRIVLRGEDGEDIWKSNELLLSENMRAAELLTQDSSQRFNMPQHLADMLQADTHDLFVLDSNTSELLQIANLARTNLQSLQKHCESSGMLTLVICPAEGSEDAFETIPAK